MLMRRFLVAFTAVDSSNSIPSNFLRNVHETTSLLRMSEHSMPKCFTMWIIWEPEHVDPCYKTGSRTQTDKCTINPLSSEDIMSTFSHSETIKLAEYNLIEESGK